MARKYVMSWEGAPHFRWSKMYRGVRYRIFCAQLNIPEPSWTKEGSYQAANEWWNKKRAELDTERASAHPHAETLSDLRRKRDYAERHGLSDEAAALDGQLREVRTLPPAESPGLDPETARRIEAARLLGVHIPADLDPHALSVLFGDARIWGERFRQDRAVPTERTIGALADRWINNKLDAARQGVGSAKGSDNQRHALLHFRRFVGEDAPVESINADLWSRWYVYCRSQIAKRDADPQAGWSPDYSAKVFSTAKTFVRWLYQNDVVAALPKNLDAARIQTRQPKIVTFADAEIKTLLSDAKGQLRLHLFLMLNCGMTQQDISDLRHDQIDLDAGTITRKRSKTRHEKGTPEVTYPLWPQTVELLREHLSADPVRALTTKSGQPWVFHSILESGKKKGADNINTNFRRLMAATGIAKSLKIFRKTSATRLADSDYSDLEQYFLGHAPRTVARRHYSAVPEKRMREAAEWLRKQYGIDT